MRSTRTIVGLLALRAIAWCQAPVISGVANSASYQPTLPADGAIVSIFGTNLADTTAVAQSVPLPLELAGTSVKMGGAAAPLFYVSPTQINLQIPTNSSGSFVVYTPAGSSAPYDPYMANPKASYAGGIFSANGSGCSQGAVLNAAADGSVSVNSSADSAAPGDYISIFGTGLVNVVNPPIGVPAPLAPLITGEFGTFLEFDFSGLDDPVQQAWSGLAPGLVGVDQVNVQIPPTTREGCAVPLQVAYNGLSQAISQPVSIAVRKGRGQCVDPPSAAYGQIIWQKTISTTNANAISESDSMTAFFEASPGQQAPPLPVYSDGCPGGLCDMNTIPAYTTLFGPACAVPGYRSLGAGAVTVQGPGVSSAQVQVLPYQQGQLGGLTAYHATLAAGAVQAGTFTVSASGGADVGAFQSSVHIGPDIGIQTSLAGIDAFTNCQPLTINWTGGDPKSWITLRFVQQAPDASGGFQTINAIDRTHTSSGTMTIPYPFPLVVSNGATKCVTNAHPVTIAVEIDPDPSEIGSFSAAGLSLGGRSTWKYVHTFEATIEVP